MWIIFDWCFDLKIETTNINQLFIVVTSTLNVKKNVKNQFIFKKTLIEKRVKLSINFFKIFKQINCFRILLKKHFANVNQFVTNIRFNFKNCCSICDSNLIVSIFISFSMNFNIIFTNNSISIDSNNYSNINSFCCSKNQHFHIMKTIIN